MDLKFRKALAADVDAVHRITARAYSVWIPVLGAPPLPMTDDHTPRVARGEVLLACDAEQVLGLIAVEPEADHDLIFNVAVDPHHAGKGIGPRLIGEVERRAKAAGKSGVRLYTNVLMEKNIALYLKLGYAELGRRPNPARRGFTIVDMIKHL